MAQASRIVVVGLGALLCLTPAAATALDPTRHLYEYSLQAWGPDDGLPQNSVESLAQSRDGYLWVGTQEGVARFSGSAFSVFDRGGVGLLPNNHVTALFEAHDDRLWIGTFGGVAVRQGRRFGGPGALSVLDGQRVLCFAETSDGTLWVGSTAGLHRLGAAGQPEDLTPYKKEQGLPSNVVRALEVDRDDVVWIGTDEGLARHHAGRIQVWSTQRGALTGAVLALAADGPGRLWVGGENGLVVWDGSRFNGHEVGGPLARRTVRSLLLDREGALWVGTDGGIARLWRGRWETLTPAEGLSGSMVTALHEDREGSLWIGTSGGGLNRLMGGKVVVHDRRAGLADEVIYTVTADLSDGLWLGTENGDVDRLSLSNRTVTHLPTRQVLGGARVRSLLQDHAGTLWIGSEVGLFRLARGRLEPVPLPGLRRVVIRALMETRSGELWVGTERNGILRGRPGSFAPVRANEGQPNEGLPNDEVRTILEDHNGRVWIGTNGGLCEWQEPGCTTYRTVDGLAHDFVRALYEDSDGTLWIGTYGGGLSRLRDGRLHSYRRSDGLLSDTLYAVLEDGEGNLWMSCNRGIFRVSKRSLEDLSARRIGGLTPTLIGREDGMASDECNGGNPGGWKTADGRLWFPTLRGVVEVAPSRITTSVIVPPTVIEAAVADGERLDLDSLGSAPAGTRRIELRFNAINLRGSRRIRFRYRLEGYDPSWVDAGAERFVPYTRLKPGRYTFRVKACNADGVWDEVGASYSFVLEAYVHQRVWFVPGVVALLLLVVGGAIALRLHGVALRERRLNERIQEALTEIRVLSGLVPICSGCKNIRDDQGYWNQLEDYLHRHTQADFSHGLCPDCVRRLYPEYADVVLSSATTVRPTTAQAAAAPPAPAPSAPPEASAPPTAGPAPAEGGAAPGSEGGVDEEHLQGAAPSGVREGVKALQERITRAHEGERGDQAADE